MVCTPPSPPAETTECSTDGLVPLAGAGPFWYQGRAARQAGADPRTPGDPVVWCHPWVSTPTRSTEYTAYGRCQARCKRPASRPDVRPVRTAPNRRRGKPRRRFALRPAPNRPTRCARACCPLDVFSQLTNFGARPGLRRAGRLFVGGYFPPSPLQVNSTIPLATSRECATIDAPASAHGRQVANSTGRGWAQWFDPRHRITINRIAIQTPHAARRHGSAFSLISKGRRPWLRTVAAIVA